MWKSVIQDFRVLSRENCSIYDAEISYTRFSGAFKRKLFDLQRGNQLFKIFGCVQEKIVRFTTRKSSYTVQDFQVCSRENCSIYDAEISWTRFSGNARAKFSFYAILSLHGAFRNLTPRITENSLYFLSLR